MKVLEASPGLMKLSMKKLEILKKNIKFRGGLLGLKDFLMIFELLLLSHMCLSHHYGKMLAREKEILERQDEEALQQAMEKERDCQRQYEERERFKEQQRQWDFDHDYFNPKNFTIFEDEMDVDAINKTPTSNNLNVNTQESVAVHMEEGVVEHVVADGLVQDQIIDKVVVAEEGVVVSSSTKKSKGKKTDDIK
ncbi:hypothetical protein Tco_1342021 [Tanacetum coccineum]